MSERSEKMKRFEADDTSAWQLLARAPCVRFAGCDVRGRPLLRAFSAVVLDGALCFHGADDGDKLGLLGQRVVASADELVAQVPSYWIHPELACPASAYYVSAIAEGVLERVEELAEKARILSAIMARYQPEGGYAAIDPEDRRYRAVVQGLMVARLRPTSITAKHKLGQHRSKRQIEAVLEGLWQRGAPLDLRAIRLIRAAHPERPEPAFLSGPHELCVAPDEHDAREVAALLRDQYWTHAFTPEQLMRAQLGSPAWVVARDHGRVIASARALSDVGRFAYVMDVIVEPRYRGHGLGRRLMELLLQHPALRAVPSARLRTRTPAFYERLGFRASGEGVGVEMLRSR